MSEQKPGEYSDARCNVACKTHSNRHYNYEAYRCPLDRGHEGQHKCFKPYGATPHHLLRDNEVVEIDA